MKITTITYKLLLTCYSILPFKKQICFLLKKSGLPYEKFYKDIRFRGKFKVIIDNKEFQIMNYGYTAIENEIFWRGMDNGWEKVSVNIWVKLSKRAKVIFDAGANTGIFSLISKTINPESAVYAFEPSIRVYDKLAENNKINHFNIHTEMIALSNANEEIPFFDVDSKHQYSATLNKEMKEHLIGMGFQINQYNVKSQTLKDYIEEHKIVGIDLIKIDVELHEFEVLEGFGDYLEKFKPSILIEILTDELARKLEPLFKNMGYLFFNIDENSQPKKQDHLLKSNSYNYLICNEESASYLGLKF